jgi:hypothetical protein
MEKFYTPKDIERKFGIERTILTQWMVNLICSDCIRWKGKILYHAKDIEDETKSKKKLKKKVATEKQPEAQETKPEPQPEPDTIQETKTDLENEFLTPIEVSEKFDISHKTLANWRSEGRGPAYHKLGKRIRYPSCFASAEIGVFLNMFEFKAE